jgi:oxygen-independent coproporphyrinogen-3 oxidase
VIEHELRLQGRLFDADRPVRQLILTGSIADRWSEDQLYRLVSAIESSFFVNRDSFNSWCACVGDALPSLQRLRLLRALGFNHIRYAPEVRPGEVKDFVRLGEAVQHAQQLGFSKTVVDLRHLRKDQPDTAQTVEALLSEVQPDRIRVFLHEGEDRSAFDAHMLAFGYRNIGMDWYLRDADSWWRSRASDSLYWTLLGYSELKHPDVIGVGPGAMSAVCEFYGINAVQLPGYSACLDDGVLPVAQGTELEDGDVLRREIIAMMLASFCIRVPAIENKWGIRFEHFFARETAALGAFERNNWICRRDDKIEILPRGCRELAQICGVFDGRAGDRPGLVPAAADKRFPQREGAPASPQNTPFDR